MSKDIQKVAVIKLNFPVDVPEAGGKHEQLNMRRDKLKDRLDAQRQGVDSADEEVTLFAILCGVPKPVIEELDWSDWVQLNDQLKNFQSQVQKK